MRLFQVTVVPLTEASVCFTVHTRKVCSCVMVTERLAAFHSTFCAKCLEDRRPGTMGLLNDPRGGGRKEMIAVENK